MKLLRITKKINSSGAVKERAQVLHVKLFGGSLSILLENIRKPKCFLIFSGGIDMLQRHKYLPRIIINGRIAHLVSYKNFNTDERIFYNTYRWLLLFTKTSNVCLCLWYRECSSKLTSLEKGPYLWPALSGSEKYNVMIAGLIIKEIIRFKNMYTEIHTSSNFKRCAILHCAKSVCIWSYSGPHFPALGLNTERISMRIRITPNTDTFHGVSGTEIFEGARL